MPSLKDIRRRIGSVKSTQKITRAMKLVASAKLRRAQQNIVAARPYARRLGELIKELARDSDEGAHPLLAKRPPKRALLLTFTSERGLCGGFNANVLRAIERYRETHGSRHEVVELAVIGKKGRDMLRYRGVKPVHTFLDVDIDNAQARASEISNAVLDDYLSGEADLVLMAFNEFTSAMSQRTTIEQLLPVAQDEEHPSQEREDGGEDEHSALEYQYEPDKATLLSVILPMYVRVEVYRAALESTASEYGARMTAMDNATNNASEMIGALTLEYNKARQAAITNELLDIVGGAEVLRG